ncbi:MAG: tetratricopeptide repeat protein [Deltaproteobacteria bacterium]|jgi:hypothetical protein|nr:tetratricopeptide repeat protein [Deltaproteobacteria bacterium]
MPVPEVVVIAVALAAAVILRSVPLLAAGRKPAGSDDGGSRKAPSGKAGGPSGKAGGPSGKAGVPSGKAEGLSVKAGVSDRNDGAISGKSGECPSSLRTWDLFGKEDVPGPWPEWRFPEMCNVAETTLCYAITNWRQGDTDGSLECWTRLGWLAGGIYGHLDPRGPAAWSRAALLQLRAGDAESAVESGSRAVQAYRDIATSGDGGGQQAWLGVDRPVEEEFAAETLCRAGEAYGWGAGTHGRAPGNGRLTVRFAGPEPDGGGHGPGDGDRDGDVYDEDGVYEPETFFNGVLEAPGADGDAGPDESLALDERLSRSRETMEELETRNGPSHPDALAARIHYLWWLGGMPGTGPVLSDPEVREGDRFEALELCDSLLELVGRTVAVPDETRLEALRLKAYLLHRCGNREEARSVRSGVVSEAKELLGPLHILTLQATSDLADSLAADGCSLEAGELYSAAADGMSRRFSGDSTGLVGTRLRMARNLYDRQDPAPSVGIRFACAAALEAEDGPASGTWLALMAEISKDLLNAGEEAAAAKVLERAFRASASAHGRACADSVQLEDMAGNALSLAGDHEGAAAFARDTLSYRRGASGKGRGGKDWLIAPLQLLCHSLFSSGRPDPEGAVSALQEALAIMDSRDGPRSPEAILALAQAADAARRAGLRREERMFGDEALLRAMTGTLAGRSGGKRSSGKRPGVRPGTSGSTAAKGRPGGKAKGGGRADGDGGKRK